MDRMEKVRNHFEEEAQEFDGIIKSIIPYYGQMVEAIVNALPFEHNDSIDVLDLGCGTGTVSKAVKDAFPNARLTCLDISDNMLQMARIKLVDAPETIYLNCDFSQFKSDKQYDAVVSSLALHHLETDADKLDFYRKIKSCIKTGGILVNADSVLATAGIHQSGYMELWKEYMYRHVSADEVENKWIPKYYEEDRPASLMRHFELLKEAGFNMVDVAWKYYNFAVYMAMKH